MKKDFDCVEMKRRGAQRVYETIKDMTREEEIEYWRRRTAEMRKKVAQRKREKHPAAS